MASVLNWLWELEESYSTHESIKWAAANPDIPVFAVCSYLIVVFYIPAYIKTPFKLRNVWALWNLLLSAFSIRGAMVTVPHLITTLQTQGFHFTLCEEPESWYLNGKPGFWVSMFIFSKIPELMDTVFLVLQKKPVIFLHWFHHVTVLLYCWHAYVAGTAPGLWFACINYCVHSIMYLYYFCSISGGLFRSLARPFAPFITFVQLAQMVMGSAITTLAAQKKRADEGCAVNAANIRMGLAMYSSYFVLFAMLFYNLYLKPGGKHAKRSPNGKGGKDDDKGVRMDETVCGVDLQKGDAAGFFHGKSDSSAEQQGRKKTK